MNSYIVNKCTARRLDFKFKESRRRILMVPLLIAFDGIDRGLRERLEGLTYTMPDAVLVPDDRLVTWVLAMAERR